MASKEVNGSELSEDDFIEEYEKLDNKDEANVPVSDDTDEVEDFDFDGHDADLNAIPSWIDEESKVPDASELFSDSASLKELEETVAQRDAYLDSLRQLQADFENYKKRVVRDQQEYAEMKNVKLMEELLPILDNFALALESIPNDGATKKLHKGVELVYNELFALLERQGLEKIESEGALFDPEVHEAVSHEAIGENEHAVVAEVLREGYKVRGRVVRPAMVKVAH